MPRDAGRVNIADVAARAGVSPGTVSNALSGRRPVSPETRRRIMAVIGELGYRPNQLARSLRTRRTNSAALIIPDITNPYYPVLARGLQDVLGDDGIHLMVANTDGRRDLEVAYVEEMTARAVDAIVLIGYRSSPADVQPAVDAGLPVVVGGGPVDEDVSDVVRSDDQQGTADAVGYLLDRRGGPVGFIDAEPGVGPSDRRLAGYERALTSAGLPVDETLVVTTDFTRQGGYDGMRVLLDRDELPRSVMCANDLIAIGAIDAIRERGLTVPDDVAVAGYDDIEAATLITPTLTTVVNPAYEMGQVCGRLLVDRITGADTGPHREIVIPARLVTRESA